MTPFYVVAKKHTTPGYVVVVSGNLPTLKEALEEAKGACEFESQTTFFVFECVAKTYVPQQPRPIVEMKGDK
jgi:hypothetical protein